ncbi:nicotinate dehydrogenase subunit A [Rhizobium subbaraonis]|uniref:Nicotinate dehydrogenase subunit A n=1 Tax=Rhizobium subbaraonis TaxID=908946 RepID=A0A285UVL9_9HYPH|nr:2Fe-2S iron-sulfur cluster-binding protein [Rhizobium subbaraonis]SOC45944.1 nicotinate dehydrogenase subunit A [Rhizobium subbaraonis]
MTDGSHATDGQPRCRINDSDVALEADEPLLFTLRNRLGLTAVRFGCGLEQCGACMVLIDGEARHSCALPASALDGRTVVTPEAIAGDPIGAALLSAFELEQAGQCGYCLAGIMMSAFALLTREINPSRARIIEVLDGHLCRCGAHIPILRAVERAAGMLGKPGA